MKSRTFLIHTFAGILCSLSLNSAIAAPDPARISVHNSTGLPDAAVQQRLAAHAPAEMLQALTVGKMTFWLMADTLPKVGGNRNFCIAFAGVTSKPSEGRHARVPAELDAGWHETVTGHPTKEQWLDCHVQAIVNAMHVSFEFTKKRGWDPIQKVALERTAEDGIHQVGPADPTLWRSYRKSENDKEVRTAFAAAIPESFSHMYDYRAVGFVVISKVHTVGNDRLCYATVGVSAAPPTGRNPRFPASRITHALVRPITAEGGAARCEAEAVGEATRQRLQFHGQLGGDSHMLQGFEKTREDGAPVVIEANAIPFELLRPKITQDLIELRDATFTPKRSVDCRTDEYRANPHAINCY